MKTYHLRGSLIVAAALTAASLWSSPLHLTSLPYSNSDGWSLESSTWDNKVVIHPEAFTFDLKNYSYKLKVNTSCSVQIGRAQWDSSNTTESNFVNMGNGGGGDFYVDITSSLANIIKAEKEEDRYCIQFNNGSGKLYSIELIATEKDPGDVNIDFTKGLDTDGTRILDGNGNEFVMRGLNGAWANLDEDFAKSASAWGCNAVRLNISNGNPADNWMGYTMSSGQLDGIIEYCEKYKMIAVPCPQNGTCMDDPAVLQYSVNFWKGMKDVLNRHVGSTILNITNEWYRGGDEYNGWDCVTTPRPQSEIDEAAKYWSEHYVSAVRELREAGIKSLILIDVAECGQGAPVLNASYMAADGSIRYYAQDIIDADAEASGGKANVAFSIHMYQISGRNGKTVRRNIDYCLDRNVPCVLGEFAFEHYIPASRFAGMTTDHSLFIECQPEESAQSSRRRAAAEPVIKLYTRPDSGTTTLSMVDPTELNMPAGMLASNPGYNLAVDSDVLNRLQADGLYIGGSGYKLMNVKAVPHGIYTEVEEIEEPVSTLPDAIFTINGIRVEEMVSGNLYIVVRNGKPEKVLFKKN